MKNILLIGGSYGIGANIASQLTENNNVIIASRSNENIPTGVTYHQFDASTDTINAIDLPDTIHGLVYCPGSINLKPFSMLKPEAFEKDLHINFMALVSILKDLEGKLKAAENASIIVFSTCLLYTSPSPRD